MIVKFENEQGVSFFDNVFMLTKLNETKQVKMSQVVIGVDPPVTVRDFDHGRITCYSASGGPIEEFDLGPESTRGTKRRRQSDD